MYRVASVGDYLIDLLDRRLVGARTRSRTAGTREAARAARTARRAASRTVRLHHDGCDERRERERESQREVRGRGGRDGKEGEGDDDDDEGRNRDARFATPSSSFCFSSYSSFEASDEASSHEMVSVMALSSDSLSSASSLSLRSPSIELRSE